MAAGRGQFFLSLLQGLQQTRPGVCRDRKKRPSEPAGRTKPGTKPGTKPATKPPRQPLPRQPLPCPPPPLPRPPPSTAFTTSNPLLSDSHENYIDRLPPEIILKIFSYLDADSLFCVGFVNRQFHKLANDNAIWYELYANEIAQKKWKPELAILQDNTSGVQDFPQGFWKRLIFREMGFPNDSIWKKELKHINPYTGMPAHTQQILGSLRVSWEITLTYKEGQKVVYKPNHTFFSDSSVTVCWDSGVWPYVRQVSTLQLHGVVHPFMYTASDKPQWRSLISKTEVSRTEKWKFIGVDKLVKLMYFDGGIIVGVYRGTWTIAFVMANLHFHKLVERSLLGSLSCPYLPQEVSPLYNDGDPDFTVLFVLHNSVRRIMHQRYYPVPCKREDVREGLVQFRLPSKHTPVMGRISFPWTAEELHGDIKNCCTMTLTLLDEGQRPFWCVSSAVALMLSIYNSEQFLLKYEDAKGKVRINFVWMQDMQQYLLTGLQVRVSVPRLNKHLV